MEKESLTRLKERAWEEIARGDYSGALAVIRLQMQKRVKQPPELVGIYGCCQAMALDKRREGIDICKQALKASPKNANLHFLLGVAYMSAELRGRAVESFQEGLEIDPNHSLIQKAMRELGNRQKRPIPFLPRSHPFNVAIGRKLYERRLQKQKRA